MRLFGFEVTRRAKAAVSAFGLSDARGWFPVLRESFAGAWQRGATARIEDVTAHSTAWACITLIASDIGKLRIKLLQEDDDGTCDEIRNPAYSPVLKKPNHYQNRIKFLESWIISKLVYGNTYVLKERNHRGGERAGNVRALYVLDPTRVQVLVAPDGAVYYQLGGDDLSGATPGSVVPASEIIHDLGSTMCHPLVGVSPIYACWRAVTQSLKIQANSEKHFSNGSQPSGVLTSPAMISAPVAERIQKWWEENFTGESNIGKVAVLGDGLKFEPMAMTAVDSQLIEQLKWGDERVCSAFHVPPYMVGVGPAPTYNNIEALSQQYYSQCLQSLIECVELCLDEGLELSEPLYTELDLEGLLRMDSATKMDAAVKGVGGGIYTPNEARAMFNKKPVAGGETPYLQEQNWPLRLLAGRELPTRQPTGPSRLHLREAPETIELDVADIEEAVGASMSKALAA
jgi:HK97 family phage portal protein